MVAALAACLIPPVYAAILPSSQVIDWTPGVMVGVPGGIPNRTLIGANVRDFGAIGDGVHDDYTSIANALAACSPNTVLYFPPGTYLIYLSQINLL